MTECPKGDHAFPAEDDEGAYCLEHGVTLLWRGPPITADDLAPAYDPGATPAARGLGGLPRAHGPQELES